MHRSVVAVSVSLAALSATLVASTGAHGTGPPTGPSASRSTVAGLELIGQATFTIGTTFEGADVGGLSGISYSPDTGSSTLVSDARTDARLYTAEIDLGDGALADGDVTFTGVTTLLDLDGQPFAPLSIDPEGIALTSAGTTYVSSEGDAGATIDRFVREFGLDGAPVAVLEVPELFLPTGTSGIRTNLAFESLTLSPDEQYLYTATENTLVRDGPVASVDGRSTSRILVYGPDRRPVRQLVYETEPVSMPPVPTPRSRTSTTLRSRTRRPTSRTCRGARSLTPSACSWTGAATLVGEALTCRVPDP